MKPSDVECSVVAPEVVSAIDVITATVVLSPKTTVNHYSARQQNGKTGNYFNSVRTCACMCL